MHHHYTWFSQPILEQSWQSGSDMHPFLCVASLGGTLLLKRIAPKGKEQLNSSKPGDFSPTFLGESVVEVAHLKSIMGFSVSLEC